MCWSIDSSVDTVIVPSPINGPPMQEQIRLHQIFIYRKQSPAGIVREDIGKNTQSTTTRGNGDWTRCSKKTNKKTTKGENKKRSRTNKPESKITRGTKGDAEARLSDAQRITWTKTQSWFPVWLPFIFAVIYVVLDFIVSSLLVVGLSPGFTCTVLFLLLPGPRAGSSLQMRNCSQLIFTW